MLAAVVGVSFLHDVQVQVADRRSIVAETKEEHPMETVEELEKGRPSECGTLSQPLLTMIVNR